MVFLWVLFVTIVASQELKPRVTIDDGDLQGTWKVSTDGRKYISFQGIPYAQPPVRENRFKEPQPVKPWLGVWDASRPLSHCLQYDPFGKFIEGSEDCLFINVHTPKLPTKDADVSLPVVVFIHSGAFMFGAGSLYGEAHVMDRDIVFVTFNYRLGPLGFLSTGDSVVPGNAGLKDQALALQWVQKNIKKFGGNPDSVTLTGCSAGGASVHYHYLSPLSEGTFNRGIAFSGSAFASWAYEWKPVNKARTLAAIVGCPTDDSREMVDCLRSRPGDVIVNGQTEMFGWKVHLFIPFTPTTEPMGTKGAFLTEYPYKAAQAGAMHRLPLITSVTAQEGLYPGAYYQRDPSILVELERNWEELASNIFEYNDTLPDGQHAAVANKIKQHYLGNKAVSQETYLQFIQALGDRHFGVSVGKLAQIHAKLSGQPTYLYRYNYRGENSLSHMIANSTNNYGVSHADDVLEIFQTLWTTVAAEDIKMRNALIDMIYSFASTGIPKIPNSPEWTPVKPGSAELDYMEISGPDSFALKSCKDFGQKSFWDSLGLIEYDNCNARYREDL